MVRLPLNLHAILSLEGEVPLVCTVGFGPEGRGGLVALLNLLLSAFTALILSIFVLPSLLNLIIRVPVEVSHPSCNRGLVDARGAVVVKDLKASVPSNGYPRLPADLLHDIRVVLMEAFKIVVDLRGVNDVKFNVPVVILNKTRVICKRTGIWVCPEMLLRDVDNGLKMG